ncbi:MAG TPA: leucyl aminopeptidase [Micromonosporaceae bacterium]|nr:leucyl aminopeptidase [Micromonosporaceae bacterium]
MASSLHLVDTDPADLAVDALVIGVHPPADGAKPGTKGLAVAPTLADGADSVAAAFADRPGGGLAEVLRRLGATGAPGEVIKLATFGAVTAPVVVAVGLGPRSDTGPAPETVRRAAAAAVRALAGTGSVALALPVAAVDPLTAADALTAAAEGALLGTYRFAGYKTTSTRPDPVSRLTLRVPTADRAAKATVKRSAAVVAAVALTRDWVNTPPNDLRPPAFADAVTAAAGKAGLEVEVLDEKALKRGGYGGILAVGLGSAAPPRLVRLSYQPAGRPTRRVALIGKGITFDTGGVSIKPAQGMWEMKGDMAGAAAVAATMLAIAALKPKVAVTAYLPMAENMPSGTAYRPGDVVTMYSGKKVEVLNTDAEGRMVLADAMSRAAEDAPDYLIETSTLTGGQVIALGKRISGLMGTPELCERMRLVGDRVGEPAWPMPLPDDVRKGMDSDVADLSQINAGMDRAGHMLQGGVFLSEFVPDGIAWAHLDIAGPSYHSGEPTGHLTKGGTGVPVRTLVQLVEDIAATG